MKLKDCEYPEDVLEIISQLMNKGHNVSVEEAVELWENYSESMCAGWISVPKENVHLLVDLTTLKEM